MKTLSGTLRHVSALSAFFFAIAISSSFAGPGGSENKSSSVNTAKNLARMNCGAQIECTTPDGQVIRVATATDQNKSTAGLIMDDDTLSYPLAEGRTIFVMKLPNTSTLDRFTFVNENATAAGDLKIFVSNYQLPATSDKWVEVAGQIQFSNKRLFNLSMVGVEARYVKLAFTVEKAGRIAAFGLYGDQTLQSFSDRNRHVLRGASNTTLDYAYTRVTNNTSSPAMDDTLNFDFANLYARAKVVYVSSGSPVGARRMIDDDTFTSFKFSANDQHPTAIVELGQHERLHRVSALYKMESGRLDIYLMNELAADAGDLSGAKLIASVTDRQHSGKAAVNFDPQGARYVALRWNPEGTPMGEGFEVAEINAFGDVPLSLLNATPMPEIFASNLATGTLVLEPAVLPSVPVVSP